VVLGHTKKFPAVVDGPLRKRGESYVVRLIDLPPEYGTYRGCPGKTHVNDAAVHCLDPRLDLNPVYFEAVLLRKESYMPKKNKTESPVPVKNASSIEGTFTLLIYEEVPENTNLYLIPNEVANSYRGHLREAHGRYINADQSNDGMQFLSNALGEPRDSDEHWKDIAGVLREYKVAKQDKDGNMPQITGVVVTDVCISGFIL
jgi:hypothetical protein